MPYKPKVADGIFYAEKATKHLFLNPQVPDWLIVNSNGGLLLSRCNGEASVEEIAVFCGAQMSDVETLFERAAAHGLIVGYPAATDTSCSNCGCEKYGTAAEVISMPPTLRTVHWKLTDDCNLRCRYCYAESGGASARMSFEDLVRVAHDVAEISPSVEYTLSGGEPLLHPDALNFADLLKAGGNTISLLTNGTLIDNTNAARIAAFSDRIKISLDGSTEDIHALTRGTGNHAAAMAAIDMLAALGANVEIAMTIHKGNRHDVDAMTRRYGAMLKFQPLFPAGRGAQRSDLHLTGTEYYEAMAFTENVAPMGAITGLLERLRGKGVKRCALADAEISISETGEVYPCQLLTEREFAAGNVRDTPLRDIYYHSPVLAKARAVSVDTLEKCQDCPIRLLCAGACRARDYHEIGVIDQVGDFCEYEQLAFLHGLFDSADF
ncbi:MAG: radical SAM protein [Magnetococcales bacterium]|nr:radical SAM protein [Magnetococcales bacterium]